jgi:hypothetical protein
MHTSVDHVFSASSDRLVNAIITVNNRVEILRDRMPDWLLKHHIASHLHPRPKS